MTPNKKIASTIMVATDDQTDATILHNQLKLEFEQIHLALDAEQRVTLFDAHLPDVLVLAFKTLDKSEQFYLELYRQSEKIHLQPHRTVVLCSKHDVLDAYELCRRAVFDDYIMFWPMTHDAPRLRMSVHNALREQQALKRTARHWANSPSRRGASPNSKSCSSSSCARATGASPRSTRRSTKPSSTSAAP